MERIRDNMLYENASKSFICILIYTCIYIYIYIYIYMYANIAF